MKKRFTLLFGALLALFALSACGRTDDRGGTQPAPPAPDPSVQDTPAVTDILIAYFSCTNTTEGVAEHIQTKTGGTLYEIEAEDPYTEDDLKYYTNCRADREQADPAARPAIKGSVGDMEKYKVIFLGYPIWHSQAPKIIYTFLESYEFAGKTIIPFCTSGSSPIGSSATNLHPLAPNAGWREGRRFPSGTSQSTVDEWIDSLGVLSPEGLDGTEVNDEIFLTIGSRKISVKLEKNAAVAALIERLQEGDITYTASDYGGFEKVGSLGDPLPRSDTQMTTQPGDVILYAGDQIVLFYGSNSWSYTKLGRVQDISAEEWRNLLTQIDPVSVKISLR